MNIQSVRLVVALTATLVPAAAIAQHEPHQGTAPQASAELVQCARVQPVVDHDPVDEIVDDGGDAVHPAEPVVQGRWLRFHRCLL